MSLKETLKTHISRKNGDTVSFEEIESICKREGRKVSNGERRLRELTYGKDPEIGIQTSRKGAIVGYYWKKKSYPSQGKLF